MSETLTSPQPFMPDDLGQNPEDIDGQAPSNQLPFGILGGMLKELPQEFIEKFAEQPGQPVGTNVTIYPTLTIGRPQNPSTNDTTRDTAKSDR